VVVVSTCVSKCFHFVTSRETDKSASFCALAVLVPVEHEPLLKAVPPSTPAGSTHRWAFRHDCRTLVGHNVPSGHATTGFCLRRFARTILIRKYLDGTALVF
jgi:hypothetical protein